MGFFGGSDGKESSYNAGDPGLIPGSGRCLEEVKRYPIQYFCLENSMERGAWRATYSSWGHKESDTTEQLKLSFFLSLSIYINKILRASLVAQLKNLPAMQETLVQFLGWKDLLEKRLATHSSILGLPLWLSWQRIHLQCGRPGFNPWVGKITWRRERLSTPVSGLENSMDCIVHGVAKSLKRVKKKKKCL